MSPEVENLSAGGIGNRPGSTACRCCRKYVDIAGSISILQEFCPADLLSAVTGGQSSLDTQDGHDLDWEVGYGALGSTYIFGGPVLH